MKKWYIFILLVSGISAYGQISHPADSGMKNMKTYYLVFLKKGPHRDQDSVTASRIQEGHMNHIRSMAASGKMDLAGPLMDEGDIRGICVYNVNSREEAEKLSAQDPAVKSGRLVTEIHPWFSQKGAQLK